MKKKIGWLIVNIMDIFYAWGLNRLDLCLKWNTIQLKLSMLESRFKSGIFCLVKKQYQQSTIYFFIIPSLLKTYSYSTNKIHVQTKHFITKIKLLLKFALHSMLLLKCYNKLFCYRIKLQLCWFIHSEHIRSIQKYGYWGQ